MRATPTFFSLLLCCSAAACTPTDMNMTTASHAPEAATYRVNPAPTQGYRIRMTIKDAPGPFAWKKALAQYDVVNRECLSPPRDNPSGRSAPVPTEDVEIPLKQISENEYEAFLYADYMQDEDYTGRGVCHWKLIQFRVHMKATGADGETLFIPAIPHNKIIRSETEVVYFNKISYPRLASSELEEPVDTGESNRARFGPAIHDSDLFTVTFEPAKGTER